MQRLKRKGVVVLSVLGLFALSGLALAAIDEGDDTVVNYGYDQGSQFFMWNVTSLDFQPDTEALAGALFEDFDALLEACGIGAQEGEPPVSFSYSYDGETITLIEVDDTGNPGDEVDLTNCGPFVGGYVTGPNGQVNHGMFLKLFNSLYDGPKRGCVIRHIAKSDLGKGEQQVQADPNFEPSEQPEPIADGSVDLTTVATDCLHGKKGDQVEGEGSRGGPPQHVLDKKAEKWGDGGPGKSGDAPKGRP